MEIIDAFCGIGTWMHRDRLLPYSPEDIIALMDHFGVRRALVHSNFTVDGGYAVRGNDYVAEAAAKCGERFLPALTMRPGAHNDEATVDDYLQAMRTAGSRAVWLVPGSQCFWPWVYNDILSACAERRIPAFLHRDLGTPDQFFRVCESFPKLRLVLVGVGYGDDWWLYPLLRRFPELSVCLGHFYIPSYGPMRFLEHFPVERLLFGSGLPFFSPGGLIAHVMYADIPDASKAKILSGNLERLLGEARL